jgi:hypothetical protein
LHEVKHPVNTSKTSVKSKLVFLAIFSVAMGFLEAMVVVYLRQIYYPEGFAFPLNAMTMQAFSFESLREISTIIMLVSIGIVAGGNPLERIACVLYCFGIWDIFYYVWLKALLNWPPSFMTWDILFLIPTVWAGPVLAPVICSLTMVIIALGVWRIQRKGQDVKLYFPEWALSSLGALLIFLSFVWEYGKIIIEGGFLPQFLSLGTDPDFQKVIASHMPGSFNWGLFIPGEGCVLIFVILLWKSMTSLKSRQ